MCCWAPGLIGQTYKERANTYPLLKVGQPAKQVRSKINISLSPFEIPMTNRWSSLSTTSIQESRFCIQPLMYELYLKSWNHASPSWRLFEFKVNEIYHFTLKLPPDETPETIWRLQTVAFRVPLQFLYKYFDKGNFRLLATYQPLQAGHINHF